MPSKKALTEIEQWYNGLKLYAGRFPARGTIGGALVVLDRLQESFNLDIDFHTTEGGSQIIGTSGSVLKSLLARYGETRPFLSEGGRTNRGLRGDVIALLDRLKATGIAELTDDQRKVVLIDLQSFLMDKVRDYHNRQRLKVGYDPTQSVDGVVRSLLDLARETGKEGPVAQHLVGAKLQLRFPQLSIGTESVSTADQQLGRAGDFLVRDSVFHVTVAPMQPVYDKCKQNLHNGLRVYLLVPDERISGARMLAEMNGIKHSINIRAIEVFVADNIAELSTFASDQLSHGFLRLLDEYNRRVEIAEIDKSLLIEIPANLQRLRQETPGA
ncbi:MAG: hypothetical protein AUK03_10470 [Anaerolineae bacterium CG2_30_64_16]|nr:MAG: hypothetical protein AUK03_10470 [Anaerolineae bacterium CG2_30_64_16]